MSDQEFFKAFWACRSSIFKVDGGYQWKAERWTNHWDPVGEVYPSPDDCWTFYFNGMHSLMREIGFKNVPADFI